MHKRKNKPAHTSKIHTDPQDQIGLERLIFFSDAIYASAITLLALEIRLPAGGASFSDVQLFAQLIGMSHQYIDSGLETEQRVRQFFGPLALSAVFLLSSGLAVYNADAAKFFWWLFLPVSLYANKN